MYYTIISSDIAEPTYFPEHSGGTLRILIDKTAVLMH